MVPAESMAWALEQDIASFEGEQHCSWIDILALAACRTGGACPMKAVRQAAKDLTGDCSPQEAAGELGKYFDYYRDAYQAALGGLVGSFAIQKDGEWRSSYGLKAFSPVAAGYGYSHCDDFGVGRSFGFKRKHLGNDLMGSLGTPIVAVEGGVVEAMGWNRYGGWRVGIRSFDGKRYYYYAHLKKDAPFAPGLAVGDMVEAGQLLGFMGRTGYSDQENVNNIERLRQLQDILKELREIEDFNLVKYTNSAAYFEISANISSGEELVAKILRKYNQNFTVSAVTPQGIVLLFI